MPKAREYCIKRLRYLSVVWELARRYQRAQAGFPILAKTAWLSTFGIGISLTVALVTLSVVAGFERVLNDHIYQVLPTAEIQHVAGHPFHPVESVLPSLKQAFPTWQFSSFLTVAALLQHQRQMQVIALQGLEISELSRLFSHQREGSSPQGATTPSNRLALYLGASLATRLKLHIGDAIKLKVMLPMPGATLQPKLLRAYLAGILKPGGDLEERLAITALPTLQQALNISAYISGWQLHLPNTSLCDANQAILNCLDHLPAHLALNTSAQKFRHILEDITMVRELLYFSLIAALALACFTLLSSLIMLVHERALELAILRSIGLSIRGIALIFLFEGILVGLPGLVGGMISGTCLVWLLPYGFEFLYKFFGWGLLPSTIYFVEVLPFALCSLDMLRVSLLALLCCLLAAILPAYLASKQEPAQKLNQIV